MTGTGGEGRRIGFDAAHGPASEGPTTVHIIAGDAGDRQFLGGVASEMGLPVRSYASGEEFLLRGAAQPGCLVSEVRLPRMSGLELQDRLRAGGGAPPIVFVGGTDDLAAVVRAMRNGAVTFLDKPCRPDELHDALNEGVEAARTQQAREERRRLAAARFATLAAEEAAVLDLLMDGLPNKAVAMRLGVGLRTVERRRATALRTLGVDSLVAAALLRSELAEAPPAFPRALTA